MPQRLFRPQPAPSQPPPPPTRTTTNNPPAMPASPTALPSTPASLISSPTSPPAASDSSPADNFNPSLYRDLSPLASWTVSTSKPGCSVAALLSPSTSLFWQSDGPQPHLLNIHFTRLVSIAAIRLYLDFKLDESYTPTKLSFWAGMGQHDLQEVVEMGFEQPRGWIGVDLDGVGGTSAGHHEGAGGKMTERGVLRARVLQMRVKENHQNGKDTHVRGLQVWGRRDDVRPGVVDEEEGERGEKGKGGERVDDDGMEWTAEGQEKAPGATTARAGGARRGGSCIGEEPDWMGEPCLR